MLAINYAKDINDDVRVNELFVAISYEVYDMTIKQLDKKISDYKKIVNNKDATELEKKVAEEKIAKVAEDKEKVELELAKVKEVHNKVVVSISSATKTFEDGASIMNDEIAVRNVLRLSACAENTQFFSICNLSKETMVEELGIAFDNCHNVELADEVGMICNPHVKKDYGTCNKLVNKCIRKNYSVPVENEYTKSINFKLTGTEMAQLHEAYNTGITVSVKKNKNGVVKHDKTALRSTIKKTTKNDGSVEYNGDAFMTNLAKLCFAHLSK